MSRYIDKYTKASAYILDRRQYWKWAGMSCISSFLALSVLGIGFSRSSPLMSAAGMALVYATGKASSWLWGRLRVIPHELYLPDDARVLKSHQEVARPLLMKNWGGRDFMERESAKAGLYEIIEDSKGEQKQLAQRKRRKRKEGSP